MRRKRGLTTFWLRWYRQRRLQLVSEGLRLDLSWGFAKHEAMARQRLARIIGREAALGAKLIARAWGDDIRFAISLDDAGFTAEQCAKLSAAGAKPVCYVPDITERATAGVWRVAP